MRRIHKNFEALQEASNRGFAELRTKRIVTGRRYLCCGSCAASGLAEYIKTLQEQGKAVTGAVWYHSQDYDAMREAGKLYIGYDGQGDVEQVVIGEMLADAMRRQGLKVTWGGSPMERVMVEINDEPMPVSPTYAEYDLADVKGGFDDEE